MDEFVEFCEFVLRVIQTYSYDEDMIYDIDERINEKFEAGEWIEIHRLYKLFDKEVKDV